jgi:cupin fold WbuC family metalloprotein
MQQIDARTITDLIAAAEQSPRRRTHHCLHPDPADPVQRLCVVGEADTYIRPHKHAPGIPWELFILARGSAAALTFDDLGMITGRVVLQADEAAIAVEIPTQQFHTLYITSPNTILFEIKPGPYMRTDESSFAPWSPREQSENVGDFLTWLKQGQVGERRPELSGE